MPIGPAGGAGQRAGEDELISADLVARTKGRDMMVDRFAETIRPVSLAGYSLIRKATSVCQLSGSGSADGSVR